MFIRNDWYIAAWSHEARWMLNSVPPPTSSLRLYHGITPETERSSHYFWCGANGYRQDDVSATEQLYQELATAFKQDLVIVAAQQRTLDHYKSVPYVDIKADGARVHARRVLERRMAQEAEQAKALAPA
jgi:vanillate O-demethylase oxygenase-like protein